MTFDPTPERDDRIMAAVMAAVEAFLSEEAQTGEGRGHAWRMVAWQSLDPWLRRSRSWTGRDRMLQS